MRYLLVNLFLKITATTGNILGKIEKIIIFGFDLPNMPWEDKPQQCREFMCHFVHNPITHASQINKRKKVITPFKFSFTRSMSLTKPCKLRNVNPFLFL